LVLSGPGLFGGMIGRPGNLGGGLGSGRLSIELVKISCIHLLNTKIDLLLSNLLKRPSNSNNNKKAPSCGMAGSIQNSTEWQEKCGML